ncbi:MAG: metallophosphoesterase, partial [Actinomycetia bacterium]|nr:metallophosphoesterase [Actinomycetes bacterium]
ERRGMNVEAQSPTIRDGAGFRFIVIADSHIRPPEQEIEAYPSNAWLVQRNEFIVDLCNRIDASFVVHLGDIVHPLPVEDTHVEAIDLATGVYERLRHPIYFVPGNHDVGDKPDALVAVPAVAEENYCAFEDAWGPSFRSFDFGGFHFVIVDTQVLNSGFDREARQRHWLEADLAAASGRRTFLFTHYPPFVRDRNENEHYDNIGEPARSWLLDLVERHKIEAVFSGHVHTFLYNRHETTDLYVAPSTGFVRPDYSEVAGVAPPAENGRDDPPKLGIFVVDVAVDGHTVRPLRSHGTVSTDQPLPVPVETVLDCGWESPIGVTLRHGWMTVTDFPTAGLDEFTRKRIRNDATVLALWEARIRDVRVPIEDLSTPDGAVRMRDLTSRGMRFTVFSAGVPSRRARETVRSLASDLRRWEIIVPPERFGDTLTSIGGADLGGVRLAIAPIVSVGASDAAFHHFVAAGFRVDDDHMIDGLRRIEADRRFDELVFRIAWTDAIEDGVAQAGDFAEAGGMRACVVVELPRGSESTVFDDDEAVADRVAEAARAAEARPGVDVFLDGFMDHDRGYYPRHGLIDRSFNPRPALYRLIEVASGRR